MRDAGYDVVFTQPFDISMNSHMCGTVVAGLDPSASVLDGHCKAHDLANLWVVDGGFFPSSAAMNPALTIAAQALRVVAESRPRRLRLPTIARSVEPARPTRPAPGSDVPGATNWSLWGHQGFQSYAGKRAARGPYSAGESLLRSGAAAATHHRSTDLQREYGPTTGVRICDRSTDTSGAGSPTGTGVLAVTYWSISVSRGWGSRTWCDLLVDVASAQARWVAWNWPATSMSRSLASRSPIVARAPSDP